MNKIDWNKFGKIISSACDIRDIKSPISLLPSETLTHIFNDCGSKCSSYDNIALTCKLWYLIATDLRFTQISKTLILSDQGETLREKIYLAIEAQRKVPRIRILQNETGSMGIPAYIHHDGIYMKLVNNTSYFFGKNGIRESPFPCDFANENKSFFSKNILFDEERDSIEILKPYTGEFLYSIFDSCTVNAFFPLSKGNRLLVFYSDFRACLWDIEKEVKLFEQELSLLNDNLTDLETNGKEIVLLHHENFYPNPTPVQFSFWHFNDQQMTEFVQWNTSIILPKGELFKDFKVLASHIIAGSYNYLCYFNFETYEEKIHELEKPWNEEYITNICDAGKTTMLFSTLNNVTNHETIYEWNVIQNEITLIRHFENDQIKHIQVIGEQIIVASRNNSLVMIDRKTKMNIWQMPDELKSLNIQHIVSQKNRLGIKLRSKKDHIEKLVFVEL